MGDFSTLIGYGDAIIGVVNSLIGVWAIGFIWSNNARWFVPRRSK